MGMSRKTLSERFWAKVEKTETCWLWQAAKDGRGYGKIQTGTLEHPRYEQAHRVAWRLAFGDAGNEHVLHRCDVKLCVRPDHLFTGSPADNAADMASKDRSRFGVLATGSKLDPEKVRAIRAAAPGTTLTALAERYGVAIPTIWKVVHRESWRRVD